MSTPVIDTGVELAERYGLPVIDLRVERVQTETVMRLLERTVALAARGRTRR